MASVAAGQEMPDHEHMGHASSGGMSNHSDPAHRTKRKSRATPKPSASAAMTGMDHGMASAAHMGHGTAGHGYMTGTLGPYTMTREASGTSWQPDTSPHEGIHQQFEAVERDDPRLRQPEL
jgi:hypothetical protein